MPLVVPVSRSGASGLLIAVARQLTMRRPEEPDRPWPR